MDRKRSAVRGLVTLAVLGALAAAMLATPVGAAFSPTKAAIKRIAAREAKKATRLRYIRSDPVALPGDEFRSAQAICPQGWFALGGGATSSTGANTIASSFPSNGGPGWNDNAGRRAWFVEVQSTTASPASFRAYAVCLKAGGTGGNYSPGANPTIAGISRIGG